MVQSIGIYLPANAGDMDSITVPGRFHMSWSNEARVPQLLKPALQSLCSTEEKHHSEKPEHRNGDQVQAKIKIKKKNRLGVWGRNVHTAIFKIDNLYVYQGKSWGAINWEIGIDIYTYYI